MMKTRYFYIQNKNSTIQGPFTAYTLDKLYHEGNISGQVMISPDKKDWKTLEEYLYPQRGNILSEKNESAAETKKPEEGTQVMEEKNDPPTKSDTNEEDKINPDIYVHPDDSTDAAGTTLQLIWNSSGEIEKLSVYSYHDIFSKSFPVALFFPILLTAAAALSVSYFYGNTLQTLCLALSFIIFNMLLVFWEILSSGNKMEHTPEFIKKVMIVSGMLWMNFGLLTCIGILYLGLIMLPDKTLIQEYCSFFASIFTLFSVCFFVSNVSIGLKNGLCSFFQSSPCKSIWFSACILTQYCGLVIVTYLVASKIIH